MKLKELKEKPNYTKATLLKEVSKGVRAGERIKNDKDWEWLLEKYGDHEFTLQEYDEWDGDDWDGSPIILHWTILEIEA